VDSRDLGRVELWEESLARSRDRRQRERQRSKRKPVELGRLGPAKLGGISAVAILGATLPSLLGGRGASHHAEKVAFKMPGEGGSVGALSARPAARLRSRPASRTVSTTISTGRDRVVPSEHFVSTNPRSTSTHAVAPKSSNHVSSTTTAPTFMTATRSTPKHTTHAVIESTMAASQQSSAQSKGSGGGSLGDTSQASSHKRTTTHRSGSDPSKTKTSSSSHKSSDASHSSTRSGGASVHHQSGTGQSHKSGSGPGGYVNPLAQAHVTPERIDQGVDYAGSGPLEAIGDGQVTYVGTGNTGWPGAFIEFRLSNGPDAGRYVYYAEDVTPARGLHVGQKISAGQVIATIYEGSSGIEIGWGAGVGTETYAMQHGQWTGNDDEDSHPTPSGKSFSALIASLGGPPGKVEG